MQNSKLKIKIQNFLTRSWPVLIILGLVVAFAFPYWAKGRVPFPADYLVNNFPPWQYFYGLPIKNSAMPDVIGQMYPFKHLVINFWKNGQVPLWNPYNFSGNPFLANYQSAVFHPANWLFFILPEIDAWSIMILMQPLLAGLFAYLFCRQLKLSQTAALLSSVAFMFCGFITVWMAYGTLSWALLWLPLVLYAIERSFQKLTGWGLILISFSLAASFFSGHFQTSLYVFLTSLTYLVFRLLTSHRAKAFLFCLLFVLLGVLLVSVQILPTFEFYRLSIRSKALGISEIIPWHYLVTILVPDFYGNPVTRNDWFGHYAEWSSFAGVIPFILALFVVFRKRKPVVFYFAILGLFSLILRHPTFLLDLIIKVKIPVFSSSSVARINGLLSFSVAILAGFGLDQLITDLKKRKFKPLFGVALVFLIIVLGVWGFLLIKKPFESQWFLVAKRNFILPSGMVVAFGILILVFWLTQNYLKNKKFIVNNLLFLVLVAIVSLTTFDMWRFAQKWMPFDSRKHIYPQLPILEFLGKTLGSDRLFGFVGMEMMNYFQIQGFDGYDPLFIQRYAEFLESAKNGKINVSSIRGVNLQRRAQYTYQVMNLLGGRYFLHAIEDDRECWEFNFWDYPGQFEKIYQDEKYEVYENKKALPRAFITYDYQVIQSDQAIVDRLLKQEADLSKTLVLEEEPVIVEPLKSPGEIPTVKFIYYRPNQVQLQVKTQTSGLLFLSDNYYPGWRVLIDGKESKIYRADYTFRALVVPSGEHQVDFVYQPNSFKLGVKVSFLSLGLVIFLASLFSRRLKK